MEQDTELEARIKNLESRLLESNQKISNPVEASKANIEENREIKESLQKLKSQRLSLKPSPSAVSVGALSSLLSSVKGVFSSKEDSASAAAAASTDPKVLLPRSVHEQSIKDRAVLLQQQQQQQGDEISEEGDVRPQLYYKDSKINRNRVLVICQLHDPKHKNVNVLLFNLLLHLLYRVKAQFRCQK